MTSPKPHELVNNKARISTGSLAPESPLNHTAILLCMQKWQLRRQNQFSLSTWGKVLIRMNEMTMHQARPNKENVQNQPKKQLLYLHIQPHLSRHTKLRYWVLPVTNFPVSCTYIFLVITTLEIRSSPTFFQHFSPAPFPPKGLPNPFQFGIISSFIHPAVSYKSIALLSLFYL